MCKAVFKCMPMFSAGLDQRLRNMIWGPRESPWTYVWWRNENWRIAVEIFRSWKLSRLQSRVYVAQQRSTAASTGDVSPDSFNILIFHLPYFWCSKWYINHDASSTKYDPSSTKHSVFCHHTYPAKNLNWQRVGKKKYFPWLKRWLWNNYSYIKLCFVPQFRIYFGFFWWSRNKRVCVAV